MCAENQIRSSIKTARLQPKWSRPKKAKHPARDRTILQGAKQLSGAEEFLTIAGQPLQIVIPTICGLCLLSIVILKILRPDVEVYSFLCVFVVLLLKSFSRAEGSK